MESAVTQPLMALAVAPEKGATVAQTGTDACRICHHLASSGLSKGRVQFEPGRLEFDAAMGQASAGGSAQGLPDVTLQAVPDHHPDWIPRLP